MPDNRFKNILVPLDGSMNSIRGLNEAISLARQSSGIITGIHVIPVFPKNIVGVNTASSQYLIKKATEFMEKARLSCARHSVNFTRKVVVSNDTVHLITSFADSNKFDLIVIGSRGQGSPKEKFLGSVANGIVLSSKVPVLVVK